MKPSPDPAPRALIFDMDDLLVRSAPIWTAAEEHLLAAIGYRWTPDLAIRYKGMNILDVARTIHQILRPSLSVEECGQILRHALIAGFKENVRPMPGAVEMVRRFHGRIPQAVASGSPLCVVEQAMAALGVRECFQVLISSESVVRGKPQPDVFLAVAAALGVWPADCLVFEDSLIGVRAAHAAGMSCFAVPSSSHAEIGREADRVFPSLADITEADVRAFSANRDQAKSVSR